VSVVEARASRWALSGWSLRSPTRLPPRLLRKGKRTQETYASGSTGSASCASEMQTC
jgi:hypothetical protein